MVTPSKIASLLFGDESDEEDYSNRLTVDSDIDSASSDEEVLYNGENREVDDEEDELDEGEREEETAPLQDEIIFSPSWSEGSNFTPELHEFEHTRSGTTEEWPCNEGARESDFFRSFFDGEVMSFISEKN